MKNLRMAAAGVVTCWAIVPIVVACGSNDDPGEQAGGTSSMAGAGNGGAPSAGSGGAGGTAGSATGGKSGSSAGGSSGSATGGQAGSAAGSAGTAPMAGSAGSSSGSSGDGAGGSASGSGGTAGSGAAGGGAGGAGGTGVVGSATFQVMSQLASEVDPDAPGTVGIVTFSVDKSMLTTASIEFGLDTTYGMTAPVDLTAENYRTLLLGMKPDKTYHFRIVASDASATYQSEDFSIETGPPTTLVSLESFEVMDAAKSQKGFIVASYWSGAGAAVPFIIDADGEIVWWFPNGPNGIARARMSADGKNMWMISANNMGAPVQRVTMDGLDAQTYSGAVGSHDITPVEGETMAFLEYGESDCDSIYEIDPSGETREVWESQTVVSGGGCHSNAIRYSKAEDLYTFSDVSTDIFAVTRMGTVEWRLSELVAGGNGAWGGTQHGHHLLESSIVVFANRGAGNDSSSIVEYRLDDGSELMNFVSGDFSANLGDVQRLPNGNTLITYSNDSIIKEIDADENVVLEISGGNSRIGYALWTPSLYDPAPDLDE
jgi:hypothetical protein